MPPAVPPGPQVGTPAPSIWRKCRRNLDNVHAQNGSFDDHLTGEFHSGGAKVHSFNGIFGEPSHAAMKVLDRGSKQYLANQAKNRVAEVLVQEWHRSGLHAAFEAISHDQVGTAIQLVQESWNVAEVITVVCVGHHDKWSICRLDTCHQRRPVAANWNVDQMGAVLNHDLLRTIRTAVVRHHNFTGNSVHVKCMFRLAYA